MVLFEPKNANVWEFHKIFPLDFFEILCDDRHSKGSERNCISSFKTTLIIRKDPSLDVYGYKVCMFHISGFIALFFPLFLLLEAGVHCSSIIVFKFVKQFFWGKEFLQSISCFRVTRRFNKNKPFSYQGLF